MKLFEYLFGKKVILLPHQSALKFVEGRLEGPVKAGIHRIRLQKESLMVFSTRWRSMSLAARDYMTSDGGSIRTALYASIIVKDFAAYYEAGGTGLVYGSPEAARSAAAAVSGSPEAGLDSLVQSTLSTTLAGLTLHQAIEGRNEVLAVLAKTLGEAAALLGIRVQGACFLYYEPTGAAKSALADLLRADLEGQAAMKRARNESATMRSLLNTARLVRENPGLLELRILTSGQKPRVSFTVSSPQGEGQPVKGVLDDAAAETAKGEAGD